MRKGSLIPGKEQWDMMARDRRWQQDVCSELFNDDAEWAYSIRTAEQFKMTDKGKVNDAVLMRMFHIGIYDWTGEDKGKLLHQVAQAMRHGTNLSWRIFQRLLAVEDKVRIPQSSRFMRY